jgi:hypothetical protein
MVGKMGAVRCNNFRCLAVVSHDGTLIIVLRSDTFDGFLRTLVILRRSFSTYCLPPRHRNALPPAATLPGKDDLFA